jgi:hypothetical protein
MSLGLLNGCFSSQVGPTEEEFKAYFTAKLTKGSEITDVTIEAAENVGTKVEPVVKSRINAEMTLIENFYTHKGRVMNKTILVKTEDKGKILIIKGIAVSKRKLDKWKIRFQKLTIKPDVKGRPLSSWRKGSYVFKGSKEEKKLRLQQDAENKIWRKKMQKLRAFATGTWVTKKPIKYRNKEYARIGGLVNSKTDENVMYKLIIPKGTKLKGIGKAVVSGSKKYHRPISVNVSFQMIDIGHIEVKELRNKCIDRWCTGNGMTWTFISTDKGVLMGTYESGGYGSDVYNMNLFRQ